MLTSAGSDPAEWKGTYIEFRMQQPDPKKKTVSWYVLSKEGGAIGEVKWFGRWRKYCFFAGPQTVFEEVCLKEIAEFIVDRSKEHRKGI